MTKNKKVLYLSYTGITDPLGQSQVLAYLKELALSGYKFFIISFEKEKAFKESGDTVKNICRESGIEWYPLPYTARPPVLSTLIDVGRMRKKARSLIKEHTISLVHCRSYIPSLVGLYLKKIYNIPFLFDMRGFWADERVDGGLWKLSNPLYRIIYSFFKKKERQFLLNADHIVSLTDNARNLIQSWHLSENDLPITVIPCCADLKLFNPAVISEQDRQSALSKLELPSSARIISYVGSLGTWYMLSEMMDFVKTYSQTFPDVYFLLLTGEPEAMIHNAANKAGFDVSRIRIKKVPRNEMPVYISLSSISLFFIKPVFSKKASSPVKQGEIMAMGVPIICNSSIGDTDEIVKQNDAGIVLREFTGEAYKDAVRTIELKEFDPSRIINGAHQVFNLEMGVKKYSSIYHQLINE